MLHVTINWTCLHNHTSKIFLSNVSYAQGVFVIMTRNNTNTTHDGIYEQRATVLYFIVIGQRVGRIKFKIIRQKNSISFAEKKAFIRPKKVTFDKRKKLYKKWIFDEITVFRQKKWFGNSPQKSTKPIFDERMVTLFWLTSTVLSVAD